ncbi:hypothetical protein BSKO_00627 [Bryopsis sp. KO-2023]|nr:hypothetical protein BSKO_00627 [Bryopsis sp. KO-2023]
MVGANTCWSLLFHAFIFFAPKCCATASGKEVKICFVVRTYRGHGEGGDGSLKRLLQSLQRSPHQNWEAVLVVMDSEPFTDFSLLLLGLSDDRIWVFADIVNPQFTAKNLNGDWHPKYHKRLYELTDEAIRRGCPPDAKWVVATNGDNEYGVGFMGEIVLADSLGAELVAFDYYSRYQRPTVAPCERFATGNRPPCKENLLRFCQTDLAANAMRRRKLVKGNYRFASSRRRGDAASSDGFLMETLKRDDWNIRRVSNRCLVAHNPSPQTCAQRGRMWDDRFAATPSQSGGTCISKPQAENVLMRHPDTEQVTIELSMDGHFQGQFGTLSNNGSIKCLRWRDRRRDEEFLNFFRPECAAPERVSEAANHPAVGRGADGGRQNQGSVTEALGRQSEHMEL